jgi:hypothetical protein
LFPPRQPARLAETTHYMLHHPLEIQRGIQAAASQLDRFTISSATAHYLNIYKEILTTEDG